MKTEAEIREYHLRLAKNPGISSEFTMLSVEETGVLLLRIEQLLNEQVLERAACDGHVGILFDTQERCVTLEKNLAELGPRLSGLEGDVVKVKAERNGFAQMESVLRRERDEGRTALAAATRRAEAAELDFANACDVGRRHLAAAEAAERERDEARKAIVWDRSPPAPDVPVTQERYGALREELEAMRQRVAELEDLLKARPEAVFQQVLSLAESLKQARARIATLTEINGGYRG